MSNLDFDPANYLAEERQQVLGAAINDNAYSPDNAVRAMQLSPVLDIPAPVIAGDLENYDKQAKARLTSELIDNSLYLPDYIFRNPMATKVSNDDWGNLDAVGQAMQKMRLPVPGLTGGTVAQGGSILADAWAAMRDAFPGEQLGKDYAMLGETLAQTPGFQNYFIRYATQAGIGTVAGVLHGLGAAGAGVAAAVGSTAKQMGVPEAWANRLTRDAFVALNVAMPELALGAPAHLAGRAMRQDVGGFVEAVRPYLEADKTPPMGVHPVIDQMHMDQATLDLQNLQAVLKASVDSSTRERAPDMYADFIRGITDGEIGISADAIRALYGEKAPAPGDGVLGWIPDLQAKLRTAETTGGDVQVPLADWLAKVDPAVAQGLEPFIRARPDGVTVAEAAAPPIVQFQKEAAIVEQQLSPVAEGQTRLYRGNRPGEVGAATAFTNDLSGIALPFRKAYGGELSFVDVPTIDLARYVNEAGTATFAEFNLPPELAAKAQAVSVNANAIQDAKALAGLPTTEREAFSKAAALGLTVEQMKLYDRAIKAQAEGDAAAISKRVLEQERRRQTKDWKEKKEALRPQVVADMYARPDIAAERLLKYGRVGEVDVGRMRIDPSYLTDEQRERMPKQYMAKDGLPPALLAEMVGYPDGEAFIAGLEARVAERRQTGMRADDFDRRELNAELDRRMEEQYGNLDQSILEMATERVLAETQVQMLHEETLALASKAGLEFSITPEGLRKALQAEFDGMPVKNLKSDKFLQTAGKAGKEGEVAMLKGDFQEAFRQKQRQYNSIVLARIAKEFEGEMAKLDKLAKRYEPRDIPRVWQPARFYIQGLLQEAGYTVKLTPDEIAGQIKGYGLGDLGDFADYVRVEGYEPDIPQWIMNPRGAEDGFLRPLEQMTTRQALEFKGVIEDLNFVGRDKLKVDLIGERKDFQAWKDKEVMPNLQARPIRELKEGPGAPRTQGSWMYGLDAGLIKIEELVKSLDLREELGPLFKGVIVPMEAGKAATYKYLTKLTNRINNLDASLGNKWYKSLGESIPQDFIYDIYHEREFKLTRWNLIKMMMNWGNVENAGRLVDGIARATLKRGEKPSPKHLAYVEAKVQNLFDRYARPEDWLFVKTFWDLFADNVPDIEKLQRAVGGKPVKWVEGRPIQTPQGVIDGKYFPLFRDKLRNVGLNVEEPKGASGLFGKDYRRATPSKHHLDERTGRKYFVDITSGPEQIIGELQRVYHDLSFREAVMQANKIINDPEISLGIKKHYGPEYYEQMQQWLERVASLNNIDEVWSQKMNDAMQRFRVNLTMSVLPLNPSVMLTPSLGTGANIPRILLEKLAHNFVEDSAYSRDKALAMTHSREIPNMLYTLDRDAHEAITRVTARSKWTAIQKQAVEKFYKPLMAMEIKSRLATWIGVWEEQKAKGRSDGEAAAWADSVVRERHPTSHFIDLPNIMSSKNEFMRIPTMFMTYFSMAHNWSRSIPDRALPSRREMTGQSAAEGFSDAAKAIWGVYGVGALFAYAVFARQKQDEPWYKHVARAVMSTPMGMVPFVREGWGWATEGYQPRSPMLSWIQAVISVGRDMTAVAQGRRPKRPMRNTAELAGATFGIPGALQIGRLTEFAYDVGTGEQKPKDIIEWMRGLMWGESQLRK